jgi:hypothetical protein
MRVEPTREPATAVEKRGAHAAPIAVKGMQRARIALVSVCVLLSCAPADTLQGSLSDEVSLSFQSVTIQQSGSTIAISFLNPVSGTSAQDIVIEIIADTTGVNLAHGGTLNLTDMLANGAVRGSVTRAVSGDDRRTFPAIARGSVVFADDPAVGAHVTGSFNVLFAQDQSGDLGAGRTVYGTFAGQVTNAAM